MSVGITSWMRSARRLFLKWSVQRPILSMSLVIGMAVTLLPVITAGALMPLATIMTCTGVIASQGFLYLIYNVVIQGLLLATVIVALFIAGFFIVTSASVFHSYRILKSPCKLKTEKQKGE